MESKFHRNTLPLNPSGLLDRLLEVGHGATARHCSRCKGHIAAACTGRDDQQRQQSTTQSTDPLLVQSANEDVNDDDSNEDESNEHWSIAGTVQLDRGGGSLGISFIGGCDTSLGCVLIQRIMPGGLAARDDRLRPGDVILQVNNHDLTRATHCEAKQALSRASLPRCEITILRGACSAQSANSGAKTGYSAAFLADQRSQALGANGMRQLLLRICIAPSPGSSRLGIKLVCRRQPPFGLFVHSLMSTGPAHRDGRLRPGDRVLELNGLDTSGHPGGWDAQMIGQFAGSIVTLLVLRSENSTPEQTATYVTGHPRTARSVLP